MDTADVWVAGVDGCSGGWLVVLRPLIPASPPRVLLLRTFAEVLALPEAPRMIAVDIPIGLPDRSGIGGRAADIEARAKLGARQSSVFAIPARAAILETDYRRACAVAALHSDPPRKISKQTFNLFRKIREVDALMTPALQSRVVECHPELAFWVLNGERPLDEPKKVKSRPHSAGLELRRHLLRAAGFADAFLRERPFRASDAGPDDLLDACACALSAERMLSGTAHCYPAEPPLDARGLRQEIRA